MIKAIFTGKVFTKEIHERLRQEVGWETEPIDGWLMHAVCFDDSGDIHMGNIWESTEKMEDGFVSRLMPVMRKIGIPPPQAEIYPVHNLNVFATTDRWPPDSRQSSSIKTATGSGSQFRKRPHEAGSTTIIPPVTGARY